MLKPEERVLLEGDMPVDGGALEALDARLKELQQRIETTDANRPIPMLLWCPSCGARHIDEGEFSTKPHHTHACQSCGVVWRPAIVPTCGVQFLPGFKSEETNE